MIWFTCKKCGKTHGRPDNSAGTLVFCDCGNGNTVPWESTTAEPMAAPPPLAAPKIPDLSPIQFDPVPITGGPAAPPRPSTYPVSRSLSGEDEERPYRRGRTEKRDPDFCFNHQRRPRLQACADCDENFCADCLAKFQGVFLCGPCKNFRARRQELPPTTSTMATFSLIIPLIAGPVMMCLLIAKPNPTSYTLSWLALIPQLAAMGLGLWALHEAGKENKGGGQWVAITGVAVASITCVLMLLLQITAARLT